MDADERLTALKKAYADIILNTAKEAAARIMVSERKALRFQHELYVAKEEAVQMLLRLKHMMDSKISEAATASLSQQKKIEELEAQLQEAEDIVNELREELREVQTELERATNNKEQQNIATPNEISDEKRFYTSQSIITQDPPESHQYESLAFSAVTTSNPNEDNKRYNLELPSIILRSKEPEPYRNGCTQRICACERNEIQEDEEEIEKIFTPSTREGEDDKSNVEKYEETRLTSWQQVRSAKSLSRKRKKASRYNRKKKTPSSRNYQDKKMDQTNYVSRTETNAGLVKTAEEVPSQVGPTGVSLEEKNGNDAKNTINNGERLSLSTESLGVPVDEKADVALVKSKAEEAVPSKPANDRIIKYQRKRKREILSNSEGNGTIGKVPLKRKPVEKTNVSLETQKSSLVPESSRDSRRLAQVARQLISLSEKKW